MIIGNLPQTLFTHKTLFITGIDTNVGKTYATGFLAIKLNELNYKTITQKFIQTGCNNFSEDIEMHRQITNMEYNQDDKENLTCPIILSYPASPHLAAEIDNITIDLNLVTEATKKLNQKYDIVILEGAGGLMVPITQDNNYPLGGYLTIDYVKDNNLPIVLVTSGKLGSINHTLLSIEACRSRGIKIELIIYNLYPDTDLTITTNSLKYIKSLNIPVVILQNTKG